MPTNQQMIEINLHAPNTPEEREMQIASNKRTIPFMDHSRTAHNDIIELRHQQLAAWAPAKRYRDGKPHLRYFNVGPSSYHIRCPLCQTRADTETVQMAGALGQLSCLLSLLSCCFPIFSLSAVYLCLQSRLKSKRLFCNKCGGHLGFYWRPT